jgi:hypothetical protein
VYVLLWFARFKLFSCNYGCIDINRWSIFSCKIVNNTTNSNDGGKVLCDGLLHEKELNMYIFFSTTSLCTISIHPLYSLLPLLTLGDDIVLMFCKRFKWRFKKLANGIKARTLHNLIIELILTLNYYSLADGTKFRMLQLASILANHDWIPLQICNPIITTF